MVSRQVSIGGYLPRSTTPMGFQSPGVPLHHTQPVPGWMQPPMQVAPYVRCPKAQDPVPSANKRMQLEPSHPMASVSPSGVIRQSSGFLTSRQASPTKITCRQSSNSQQAFPAASPRAIGSPLNTSRQVETVKSWSQSLQKLSKVVISLDKSYLEPTHPSNLSNSSAGTCGSDIGYASTTSSEHVNDSGVLSESTASSSDLRRIIVNKRCGADDVQTRRGKASQSSLQQDAKTRRPCRSMSPTPSPKESAVPVPTRLCNGLAVSPRKPVPAYRSLLAMPKSNGEFAEPEVLDDDDALCSPDKLDQMYDPSCNLPAHDDLASKVSDALREAERARERALAALGKYSARSCSTPQPPLPSQSPRWAIPSIWESGEVHGDLISWFADELGVSKGGSVDLGEELIQTYRDHSVSPGRKSIAQPRIPTSSTPEEKQVKPAPFASVLAARPPPARNIGTDDSFAPEPRLLADIS